MHVYVDANGEPYAAKEAKSVADSMLPFASEQMIQSLTNLVSPITSEETPITTAADTVSVAVDPVLLVAEAEADPVDPVDPVLPPL